jgi:hypothetical protein
MSSLVGQAVGFENDTREDEFTLAATLTATLLGSDPVYDTLRKRMLRVRRPLSPR